jgi:tetratricopeptide (TPR) repeat protein
LPVASLRSAGAFGVAVVEDLHDLGAFVVKRTEALVAVDTAIRLDPRKRDDYLGVQGFALTLFGRSEEAIAAFKPYLARYPDNFWVHALLAVGHMELGHDDAARAEVAEDLRLDPQLTVEKIFPTGQPGP